jgi:flavodoxin I
MNTLVIYDSLHGNTKKIAQAMGDALAGEISVLHVSEANPAELKSHDLVFVGAPTHGGRPSPPMKEFLDKIQASELDGVQVAAFDTRLPKRWVGIFGFAAGRIAKSLERQGGTLMGSPEGFFVEGTEGPLRDGELERAAAWAREIAELAK